MQQLSQARTETQEAEQRRSAALSEITAHRQAKADRAQELAEVGNQLEVARQQETQTYEDLARLAQENAVKTADVAPGVAARGINLRVTGLRGPCRDQSQSS